MEIAAVMGGYYWMGFLGGLLLTMYQIHGLLWGQYAEPSWRAMRSHVLKLGVGLMLGSLTLLVEAKANHNSFASMHTIHLNCRLVQGFLGAFLFFYAYLLAATAFEGRQQVFALTLATISLNVAEVFGPFVGAWIFSYWGLQATYYVLAALSILNNVLLLVTYFAFPRDEEEEPETQPLLQSRTSSRQVARTPGTPQTDPSRQSPRTPTISRPPSPRAQTAWLSARPDRWLRLQRVLTDSWLLRSLIVIAPAAMVKSSFESILPLFGSNHGYNEFEVGILFTMVACGFIVASVTLGWVACTMLYTWGEETHHGLPASDMISYLNHGDHALFHFMLVAYGVLLGLTHTGASLSLGEVLEELSDERSQGAANGMWNTGWELGGSIGFIVAGVADTDSWRQEQKVLTALGCLVFAATGAFLASFFRPFHGGLTAGEELDKWEAEQEIEDAKKAES